MEIVPSVGFHVYLWILWLLLMCPCAILWCPCPILNSSTSSSLLHSASPCPCPSHCLFLCHRFIHLFICRWLSMDLVLAAGGYGWWFCVAEHIDLSSANQWCCKSVTRRDFLAIWTLHHHPSIHPPNPIIHFSRQPKPRTTTTMDEGETKRRQRVNGSWLQAGSGSECWSSIVLSLLLYAEPTQ